MECMISHGFIIIFVIVKSVQMLLFNLLFLHESFKNLIYILELKNIV